jgi:hypothetical protein
MRSLCGLPASRNPMLANRMPDASSRKVDYLSDFWRSDGETECPAWHDNWPQAPRRRCTSTRVAFLLDNPRSMVELSSRTDTFTVHDKVIHPHPHGSPPSVWHASCCPCRAIAPHKPVESVSESRVSTSIEVRSE